MKALEFLATRKVAIVLLVISVAVLAALHAMPWGFSPFYLLAPGLTFLSVAVCLVKRTRSAVNRDIPFWGSFVFHVGLLVVMASGAAGAVFGMHLTVSLPQGMLVSVNDARFAQVSFGSPPAMFIELRKLDITYEKGVYDVDYAADISVMTVKDNEMTNADGILRINGPMSVAGYDIVYSKDVVSPLFRMKDKDGKSLLNSYYNVSNDTAFEDAIKVPGAGMTLYTRYFPDMYIENGKYGTRSLEPKNPAFGIRAVPDAEPSVEVWRGVLKYREKAVFNGYELDFAELRPVLTVAVIKDPSYWGLAAGLALIVCGLVVRYMRLLGALETTENVG